jgi:hypothetical protein
MEMVAPTKAVKKPTSLIDAGFSRNCAPHQAKNETVPVRAV